MCIYLFNSSSGKKQNNSLIHNESVKLICPGDNSQLKSFTACKFLDLVQNLLHENKDFCRGKVEMMFKFYM